MTVEKKTNETSFDPDLSPSAEVNRKAAEERRLRYSSRRQTYVDEDGCLRRDRFGQPL